MRDENVTPTKTRYLIVGITDQGHAFRPSDWAERLAGVVALFVDERGTRTGLNAHQFTSPIVHDGIKSLLIDATLREACPSAFTFLSCFAAENGLTMRACPLEDGYAVPAPSPCEADALLTHDRGSQYVPLIRMT